MRNLRCVAALLMISSLLWACGDDDQASTTSTAAATSTTVPSSTVPSSTVSSSTLSSTTAATSSSSSSTSGASSMVSSTTSAATMPGEPFDLAPAPGVTLAVMGVRHDDVLNVRALPGTDQRVVATLAPTADDFTATGRARILTRTIWFEITTSDGTDGWVNSSYVARLGPVIDITSDVVAEIGEIPTARNMTELGALVADAVVDEDSSEPTTVTLTVAESVGDLGEVTYDVVGLADDALAGLRLHVFGQPDDSGGGFSLGSVEATELCMSVRGAGEPYEVCV